MFFVVSGPSGSGKTTLSRRLVDDFDKLKFVISYTTRKMRPGELNGNDYRFVKQETFKLMIDRNEFAEWAMVHGNYYGTPVKELVNSQVLGDDILLDINIEGAMNIKDKYNNGIYIFLLPPSMEILKKRLRDRKDLSEDEVDNRMEAVRKEIELSEKYDYIIVNDEIKASYEKLASIITAERCKSSRILKNIDINYYINR